MKVRQTSWLKVHESVVENDKAVKGLTKDLWILWKLTAETHYQIFLLCIMKIHQKKLSKRTVQRRLHEQGYHRRAVKKTTTISKQNRLKRRFFCRVHLQWKLNRDWSRVIFWDETQTVLGKNRKTFLDGGKIMKRGNHTVLEFTVLMTHKLHS